MNKTEILVTGRNEEMLQRIVKLINNNDKWIASKAAGDEEAIEKFHQQNFDVVLFPNGIEDEEEIKLRKIFSIQSPDIIIIRHDGSDGSLLTTEITEALDKKRKDKKPSLSFVDDALKNAGLNIIVQ
ncbi:MAG: hypothetical protein ACXWWC_05980 [Chitinophagaceae bacterium]